MSSSRNDQVVRECGSLGVDARGSCRPAAGVWLPAGAVAAAGGNSQRASKGVSPRPRVSGRWPQGAWWWLHPLRGSRPVPSRAWFVFFARFVFQHSTCPTLELAAGCLFLIKSLRCKRLVATSQGACFYCGPPLYRGTCIWVCVTTEIRHLDRLGQLAIGECVTTKIGQVPVDQSVHPGHPRLSTSRTHSCTGADHTTGMARARTS